MGVLNRWDRNGDGIISGSEADLMAQANVLEEREKKKYKQFLAITVVILFLTLTANFGLTIATIYLTRQFEVEDGTLVDRSTGKQVTTKTRGNYMEVTFGGGIDDGSGRLLDDSMCVATITMSDAQLNDNIDGLLHGTQLHYGIVGGKVEEGKESGQVTYISGGLIDEHVDISELLDTLFDPHSDLESLELDYDMPMEESFWQGIMDLSDADSDLTCTIIPHVGCTVGEDEDKCYFFIICCGDVADALFTTGNCCIYNHKNDSNRDMRRLGKCSQ